MPTNIKTSVKYNYQDKRFPADAFAKITMADMSIEMEYRTHEALASVLRKIYPLLGNWCNMEPDNAQKACIEFLEIEFSGHLKYGNISIYKTFH